MSGGTYDHQEMNKNNRSENKQTFWWQGHCLPFLSTYFQNLHFTEQFVGFFVVVEVLDIAHEIEREFFTQTEG